MRRRDVIAVFGGAIATWPLTLRAQQPNLLVGFLSSRSPEESRDLVDAFRGGLKDGGFAEGQNATVEYRWAHGDYTRLPALAHELVSQKVALIAAVGGDPSPLAAKAATSNDPNRVRGRQRSG
jgi:putative ABC transport system substrate-binding protein